MTVEKDKEKIFYAVFLISFGSTLFVAINIIIVVVVSLYLSPCFCVYSKRRKMK